MLCITTLLILPTRPTSQQTQFSMHTEYTISETTYTNKTMHFQETDPYEGYSYWTFTNGTGGDQGAGVGWDDRYGIDTEYNGDIRYFGFAEFTEHSLIHAEIIFKTTLLSGTYHFQPLGYFYQNTSLTSNIRWALMLYWDASGIDLYYNSANGQTPSSQHLSDTAPSTGINYQIILSNFGTQTYVYIQDISTSPTYPILYEGNLTTNTYDATSLYAGFGQYCSTPDGHIYGWYDNFSIIDTSIDLPDSGYGFDNIDVYLDEEYTHTFYSIVDGLNSTLEIDVTVSNITLVVQTWVNGTLFDIDSLLDGKNKLRHNITITNTNMTTVFSQSNFTYIWGIEYTTDIYLFQHWLELDYPLVMGEIYTIEILMEVWF